MSTARRAADPALEHDELGFVGWSPETTVESESYSVAANIAGVVAPDRVTSPTEVKAAQRSTEAGAT